MKSIRPTRFWILPALAAIQFCACQKSDDPTPAPPPPVINAAVSSFVPKTATAGDVIRISGVKFTGATAVTIGNTAAQSFQVISDTVIMAYVSAGASSGNVSVTAPTGNADATGFVYYTPQQSTLTGTMMYATLSSQATAMPTLDSSKFKSFTVQETISFRVRNINPNDVERNVAALFAGVKMYKSRFVDSPNYVILSSVISQDPKPINGYGGELNSFTANSPSLYGSVFAKVVGETITIPSQTPINGYIFISGSGVIKNGVVVSLDYVIDDSHGNSKRGLVIKP